MSRLPRQALFLLLFFCTLLQYRVSAQHNTTDLALLEAHQPGLAATYNGRTDTVNSREKMVYDNQKTIAKINPLRWLATGSMYFYQQLLSPQLNAGCLYQRTCSNYSKAAIKQYGIIRGVLLTADRLSRCTSGVLPEIVSYRYDAHGHIIDEPQHYFTK
jgi:putative component of membrane protein insertase Oxa1/YidC/SpoIIIJ protein YidD